MTNRAEPHIINLTNINDERGGLGVVEAVADAGFTFERFYFLHDVPSDGARGAHAHKRLRQVMIALAGSVTVSLQGHGHRWTFRLDSPRHALLVPPGLWRELTEFSKGAVIGVLASESFDEADYIRDYDDFLAWESENRSPKKVPYVDLARYDGVIGAEISSAVNRVVKSGWYIGGPEVADFESEFAAYCGAAGSVGVANGLQALSLALRAAGIGSGDEVIIQANTFVATALAVAEVGATPILADIELTTGCVDVTSVASAITPRTAAIIAVHLYGHPADMDALRSLSEKHGLFLLEDAAQAHGAMYKGRRCGALGDAAAFSFYPTKNLGALGDAGAVVGLDADLLENVRLRANYGSRKKYHNEVIGTNSRLDPIHAAVLRAKLRHLDAWNDIRRQHARRYADFLSGLHGLAPPHVHEWADPVWHVFPVRLAEGRRDDLRKYLEEFGIGTNVHYPVPVSRQPCFADAGWRQGQFPVAERAAEELLSLPLDPMHTTAEIDRVIERIQAFFREC